VRFLLGALLNKETITLQTILSGIVGASALAVAVAIVVMFWLLTWEGLCLALKAFDL
jgi:hypothetical protein